MPVYYDHRSSRALVPVHEYSLPVPCAVTMGVFTDALQTFSSEKEKEDTGNQHWHTVSESTFTEERIRHYEDHKSQKH